MRIEGHTFWITGASSGIGEALAEVIAEQGGHLVLSARSEAKLVEIKNRLSALNSNIEVIPLDLSDPASVNAAHEQVLDAGIIVDVLINNGGISQRGYLHETKTEVIRTLMEVNFFGAIAATKCVLPGMLERSKGKVVMMSSVVGKFGFPLRTGYSASKHALHGFAESLALEYEDHGITTLVVCPGRVKTNISKNALQGDGTSHGEMDPGQANGISARACADKIVRAIRSDRREIHIGKERFLVMIHKYMPWLFRSIVRKVSPK